MCRVFPDSPQPHAEDGTESRASPESEQEAHTSAPASCLWAFPSDETHPRGGPGITPHLRGQMALTRRPTWLANTLPLTKDLRPRGTGFSWLCQLASPSGLQVPPSQLAGRWPSSPGPMQQSLANPGRST